MTAWLHGWCQQKDFDFSIEGHGLLQSSSMHKKSTLDKNEIAKLTTEKEGFKQVASNKSSQMDKKLLATGSKNQKSEGKLKQSHKENIRKYETTETPWVFDRAVASICQIYKKPLRLPQLSSKESSLGQKKPNEFVN